MPKHRSLIRKLEYEGVGSLRLRIYVSKRERKFKKKENKKRKKNTKERKKYARNACFPISLTLFLPWFIAFRRQAAEIFLSRVRCWSCLLTSWSCLLSSWSCFLTSWSCLLTSWSCLLTSWSSLLTSEELFIYYFQIGCISYAGLRHDFEGIKDKKR